jgi:hypothetical protein
MMRNQRVIAVLALCAASAAVFAVDPPAPTPAVEAPSTPTPSPSAAAQKFLTLTEIESRLAAQGIHVREMEVRDKVLEVEGTSTQEGKVELLIDRRTGEILSRRKDD